MVTVAELAPRYGFPKLGPFAAVYRTAFGEAPSTALNRAPETRSSSR